MVPSARRWLRTNRTLPPTSRSAGSGPIQDRYRPSSVVPHAPIITPARARACARSMRAPPATATDAADQRCRGTGQIGGGQTGMPEAAHGGALHSHRQAGEYQWWDLAKPGRVGVHHEPTSPHRHQQRRLAGEACNRRTQSLRVPSGRGRSQGRDAACGEHTEGVRGERDHCPRRSIRTRSPRRDLAPPEFR